MCFNWFIGISNCPKAEVKTVGLCIWEREGRRKKGSRGKMSKDGRCWEIAFPFGQFISSVQLLTKSAQAVISQLTIIRWPSAMKMGA